MNKIFKILSLLSIVAIMFASCSPDEFELGTVDVNSEDLVEGIAFTIEHDANNPNIIYLKSLMGSRYTPLWNHPQGRSQKETVTLKIPFAGTYDVQFGIMTRGGAVYGETVTFTVDDMYAGFISDEMWTLLSGGQDQEKTWYLDLDADAVSRYFIGPLYFYGSDDNWQSFAMYADGSSDAAVKEALGISDTWHWDPDYAGNSWLMSAADFGSMTFSLKGGAYVSVDHKTISSRGVENGTYMIDTENYTMKISDAAILHDSGRDAVVVDWGDIRIMSLTNNTMQLGVIRDAALSGEGVCLLVYNFISKDYFDNWTPSEEAEPEPTLPDGWKEGVSQTVSKSIKWVLSPETPFNWAALDGSFLNNWPTLDSYDEWTGFNASVPDTYATFSLTLNSDDYSATYVSPDGVESAGTYTLDDKGVYTFTGFKPSFTICSWVSLSTTEENQWRITKVETDASGNVKGMWVGSRDPQKDEYMVYHLIPQSGNTTVDPLGEWKKAFVGKTFKPDVNWFIDWLNFDFTGGWTSASTFGTDYTSNNWVWNEKTNAIAQSARLKFEADASDIKVTFTQDLYDADGNLQTTGHSVTGIVVINPDIPSLTFEFPLVNYQGSAGSWLNTDNAKGAHWTTALGQNEWLFVSHGGNNLSNINTEGFWLGTVSNSIGAGDGKDELLVFRYVLAD